MWRPKTLTCGICGKEFTQRTANQKYCGALSCKKEAARRQNKRYRERNAAKWGLKDGAVSATVHNRYYTCYRDGKRCRFYDGGCFTEMGDWKPKCKDGSLFEPEPEQGYRQSVKSPFGKINMPGVLP